MAATAAMAALPRPAAASSTLGFVITTWNNAIYETKFIDECPRGLADSNHDYWWASLSRHERAELTVNGMTNRPERWREVAARGRDGADACIDPTSVDDPPLLTVEGKISYGMNLDGNIDGAPTPNTCRHENFTSPDGVAGIDNQFYRVVGCIQAYRSIGYFDANPNESRKMQALGIILMEITGVDDPRNDDAVDITFYRSIDGYAVDSTAQFVPFGSYRIDTFAGRPRYGDTVKGRIAGGVLTTDPGDVRLPYFGNYTYQQMLIRDMRMEFAIAPDGKSAAGLLAGYYDVEQMYHQIQGIGGIHADTFVACGALYDAAHAYADGYPDPVTGKCTALSAAWKVNAVAAYIIHPERDETAPAAARPGLWARLKGLIGG
jgi:hypothetical protein